MKVTLTAEGTYPHQFGGVSVWCDQLIRALPGYGFGVVALVASGTEPVRWDLPANVTGLTAIPLWGPPPARPGFWPARSGPWPARPASGPARSASGPARPAPWRVRPARGRGVPGAVRELTGALLRAPVPGVGGTSRQLTGTRADQLGEVLRELAELARERSLTAAPLSKVLSSEAAVRLLHASWLDRWPGLTAAAGFEPPTLHDAVTVARLIEHALRPLAHPPARADLTHVVTNGLGTLPALTAKWRYGTPLIVSEHGVYLREQYLHLRRAAAFSWPVKELYLRFLAQLCVLGYREAELIIPGNAYNRRWETQLGADPARIRTVYNGVDPADFPLIAEEPGEPVISWVGRIDPIKDLETLLRAHARILRQLPGAKLRIFGAPAAGQEPYLRRCQELARELDLTKAVTFEGRVPDVTDAYAAGSIVVLCSISEGFPYSLIEAMACGRACVATDVGGVSEALADGAGLVVPPRNPAALAAACLRLLRHADQRAALGAAARRRALGHFRADEAIGTFDEIYTRIGRPPAGRETGDGGATSVRSEVPGLSPVITGGGPG